MIDESEPVETVTRCKHCGVRLGAQNPGDTCCTCKYETSEEFESERWARLMNK
jgi:hypothetical protein